MASKSGIAMLKNERKRSSQAVDAPPTTEECSICLNDFKNQEVGMPEGCQHMFCFTCLFNWSTEKQTCPLDREPFEYILKKESHSCLKPYARVNAKDGKLEALIDVVVNAILGKCVVHILKTEICISHRSYHPFCLNSSNTEAWTCPSCGHTHGKKLRITSGAQQRAIDAIRSHRTARNKNSPQSTVPRSQVRFMSALKQHRRKLSYLPSKVPVARLPRIKRRIDAPSRPQIVIPKAKLSANASFIDQLLYAQNNLRTLENVQMHGVHNCTEDDLHEEEKPLSLTLTLQMNKQYLRQTDGHQSCHTLLRKGLTHSATPVTLPNSSKVQSTACQTSDELPTMLNLRDDEIQTLCKISAAIDQIIYTSSTNKMDNSRLPLMERMKRSQHSSSPMSIHFQKQERYQRQRQIIDVTKQELKPIYKQRLITKAEYKKIMKRVVDKATYAKKNDHKWIKRMIDAYVNIYRKD
ncbi:unnamed protein product [Adineta ricciae]|uniref:RING-type domain-containing protein n=1 Tax=Adineta ricciae TaxID=249248 RepID=A0A813QHJ6_ADIRI|nr:unnamed protein product [Adineta ricciae]